MILQPGSFSWLLAHDMRLAWRSFMDVLGAAGWRTLLLVLLAGGAVLHLLAWPAIHWLTPLIHGSEAKVAPLAAVLVCTFTWMMAQSLFGVTRALFDRGDLDLLLGSPLPVGRVFAAKVTAIAAGTLGSVALLTVPIANMGALVDRAAWLGMYPALIAMALIATALGLGLAIGLFFLLGPRRARTVTQLAGACLAGSFVLGAQIVAMLPAPMRRAVTGWLDGAEPGQMSVLRLFLWMPIDAIRGDVGAMLLMMAVGLAIFAGTIAVLGGRFAKASLEAAGAAAGGQDVRGGYAALRFRSGLAANLRVKEWRLLLRDPSIFSQLGLQIIYTIPIAVVLLRSETVSTALALAPTIVVVAAQVAASLSWITVSGEDAPELIQSAPVPTSHVERAKLSAVFLPVLAIVGLPLIGLAFASWQAAVIAALYAALAGASTALVNFWHPMPGNRRGMLRRHSQSKLIAMIEHVVAILWAIAIVLALMGSVLTLVPIAAATAVVAGCRVRHRRGNDGAGSGGSGFSLSPLPPATAAS